MKTYTIVLDEQMLNTVFKGLGELSLKESLPTFTEINRQATAQSQKKQEDKKNA